MLLRFCTFGTLLLITLMKTSVNGDAFLEIKMIVYDNAASLQWDGSSCDPFWGSCDHYFLFTIDNGNGRTDGKAGAQVGSIFQKWSGYFQDQNRNTFGADISGVSNPIVQRFDSWPGKVLFKVYVKDDDSIGSDDEIDAFIQPLDPQAQGTQSTSQWTDLVMRGLRSKDPSSLQIQYRLYCGANYYGQQCTRYCVAQDTNRTGHYTCDPNTGDYICFPGWADPSRNCTTPIDQCEKNACRNGASCISLIGSYKCACRLGFSGTYCELPLNIQCRDGFVGVSCDVNICDFKTCKNGGTCTAGVCRCATGYSGDYCEITDQVTCMDRPCQHEGTCYDVSYTCDCLPDYMGTNCELMTPPVIAPNTTIVERQVSDKHFVMSEIFGSKAGGLLIALIIICAVLLLLLLLLVFCVYRLRRRARNAEKECGMLAVGASKTVTTNSDRKVSHNTYAFSSQSSVFSDISEADSSVGGRHTSVSELIPPRYADCKSDPHYDTLDKGPYDFEKETGGKKSPPPVPKRPKVEEVKDVNGERMSDNRKSTC